MELDAVDPAVEDVQNWLEIEMTGTEAEDGRALHQDQPHSSGVYVARSTQASICVTPNAIAESSRAGMPWLQFQQSELLQCRIVFDCGDGGFFFQPCSPELLHSSKSLKDHISHAIGAGKCKQVLKPAVGTLCLAPFDREYHRAEIIASKAEETWQLFYIDYGNTKILKATDLLTLPEELQAQCRLCAFAYWDQVLAGEKNGGDLRSCFDFETESAALTFRMQITTGQYIVQIGPQPANAIFKVEKSAPLPRTTYQWSDCEFSTQLKSNKLVRIVFDWNPTTFHVVALADNGELAKLHQLIRGYAAKAIRFRTPPSRDEIVLAKYEDTFFRAKVDNVEGDLCTCSFIDYGGPTLSNIHDLIPVNNAIMKYPILGMTVRLNNVPEGFGVDWHLDDSIFNYCFKLELVQNGRNRPADRPYFDAHLSCGKELENVCLPLSVPIDSDLEQQFGGMSLTRSATTQSNGQRKLAVASTSRRFRRKLPRSSESFTQSATPTRKRRHGEETESTTKRSKSLLLIPSTSGSSVPPYFTSAGSLEYVCEEMDTLKISWNGDDEEM